MSDEYVARSRNVAARRLGDEMVVMSAVDSTLFTLNEAGAEIWQAADGKTPLRTIVLEKICRAFDVTADEALADARDFVRALAAHGILYVAENPIAEAR